MSNNKTKIAVVHDHLGFKGGGERTAMLIAIGIGADFITAYSNDDTFPEHQHQLGKRLLVLSRKVIHTRVARFFWLRFLFWKKRRIFKNYSMLIASGQTATEAVARHARRDAAKIVYTHTTPRRVFDQYEFSKKMYPPILRPFYALFARFWKRKYLKAIFKFDFNVANSECVRVRIKKYIGGDVNAVIWPPILTDKFKWLGQKDYYLSWSRIDEAKRVELVAEAFKMMPDKKLIIVSGGPRMEAVKKIAENCPNIEIRGWVGSEELYGLAGNCIAAIYIPIDEDAGMSHLEANSAGKPYLGVREGGLIESTVEGETGILIKADPQVEDVIAGINMMTENWCLSKREVCENHASKYDKDVFLQKIHKVIEYNNTEIPVLGIDASRWENPGFPGKGRRTGVEMVAKNLIEKLIPLAEEKGIRLRLYTPRTIDDLPLTLQKVIPGKKQWTRKLLSRELKYSPVQYFFTPSYYIPDNSPVNSFSLIHDIIFRSDPGKYPYKERLRQEYALKQNLKRSKKIITISEYSKGEISKYTACPAGKIEVASLGYQREEGIDRSRIKEKIILYIGRIEKKKSVDVLLEAFNIFSRTNPGWRLIMAGGPGFGFREANDIVANSGLKNIIELTGYVSEEKKWELLCQAAIFVHPSAHEGSCIPLFEAWDAGVPAIVAETGLMKEIAQDGAVYFNPGDPNDLSKKIEILAENNEQRNLIIEKGFENLQKLTWKNTAEKILNIILDDRQ